MYIKFNPLTKREFQISPEGNPPLSMLILQPSSIKAQSIISLNIKAKKRGAKLPLIAILILIE
jgi:hypothetical protein